MFVSISVYIFGFILYVSEILSLFCYVYNIHTSQAIRIFICF